MGLGDFAPLAVKVKVLGSSIDCRREEPRERVGPGGGGGGDGAGGDGADDGGGGGGTELGEA